MKKAHSFDEENLTQESIEEVEHMLIRRWKQLYPEWEMVIISLPKNDAQMRKRILEHLTATYTSKEFEAYCEKCRNEKAM